MLLSASQDLGGSLPSPSSFKGSVENKELFEEQELLPTGQNPINCHGSSMKGQGNGTRSVPEPRTQQVLWEF